MACIEKIYSVSAMVGTGKCNADCSFCAGKFLRDQTCSIPLYEKNLEAAIKLSARYGGWSLSLTSSGEATCEPEALTRALTVYNRCSQQGAYFPNVNLFTNGILLGDDDFCQKYLPLWKHLGLNNIAISIHATDERDQAYIYGVREYPPFHNIVSNIEKRGIGVRATLLLRKGGIDNSRDYERAINTLFEHGFNNITTWPLGNPDGSRNKYTPSRRGLWGIRYWLWNNCKLCHGHVWGGGVYDYKGNLVRFTDYVTRHDPKKDYVRQLVVFQDGTVAYSWIREGALCMK
jgi:sulfatase maturation enzyme AslB (radical SAM superfamily)